MRGSGFSAALKLLVAMTFTVITATSLVTAQIPRTISYQGVLTDNSGNPLPDGSHSVDIRIYREQTGGAAVFTESHTVMTEKGVFNIIIGSNTPIPTSMKFDIPYYLAVMVDGGSEMSPRTPMTSVPYALHAAIADELSPGATGFLKGINALDGTMLVGNPTGPVATVALAPESVVEKYLGDGSVTTAKLGDGSVTLPKISAAGASAGQVLTFDGANINWTTPQGGGGGLILPYSQTVNNPATLFSITQTGAGGTTQFAINNSSNNKPVIDVSDDGTGDALRVLHTGVQGGATAPTGGRAAYFATMNGNNAASTVEISQAGTGHGISSAITNAANPRAAVIGRTNGTGWAGYFAINNIASTGDALYATTNGIGSALHAYVGQSGSGRNRARAAYVQIDDTTSTEDALYATNSGAGAAVRGVSSGNGIGVFGQTTGSGYAGYFSIGVTSNSNSALAAYTAGTGNGLLVNHGGSSGNIAVFQSSASNKARIDKNGKGFFNGGTQSSGADVAEAFEVTGDRAMYEPGDILVISTTADRTVERSAEPYSTLVAGVYATKPGVLLTEREVDESLDDMVPMGVVGVIPTKVTTENGPIRRGDLLVTSGTAGHAMRGDRDRVEPGMVIGKALQDYDGDAPGVIKVLVNVK